MVVEYVVVIGCIMLVGYYTGKGLEKLAVKIKNYRQNKKKGNK